MSRYLPVVLLLSTLSFAKDVVQVEVKAVHAVTHEDRGNGSVIDKGILGAHVPTKDVEVYNLDAIINGEHTVLVCEDEKGCEAPALGTYEGEMKRRGFMKLSFNLPVTHKAVSHWHKIAGSW